MKRPIRVLHLMHDSRRSGVPAVVYSLLTTFDRSEVLPSAFFAHDGVYAGDLREAGIEVITLGRRTPFVWRFKRFLGILLLPFLLRRFDIIHAHSVKMAPMALAAKLFGATVVFHLHEKTGRLGAVGRAIVARADKVVFCAENCARHYAGIPMRSSETILNAISIPKRLGLPREERCRKIVMLGSINRNKGQDILVRAFASLHPCGAELRLYGTTGLSARSYVRDLQNFVKEEGLQAAVFFPGPTSDAPAVFRESYLLVHSSLNECLSISILEAMAHGVPVIANDIPGMREIIDDGVNGFLVSPGDSVDLAGKIGLLLENTDLWRLFSVAGQETVRKRFDMRDRSKEFVRMYQELVSHGPGEGKTG
jgi:glycosyltransferase involved in cell wall biosynthesis